MLFKARWFSTTWTKDNGENFSIKSIRRYRWRVVSSRENNHSPRVLLADGIVNNFAHAELCIRLDEILVVIRERVLVLDTRRVFNPFENDQSARSRPASRIHHCRCHVGGRRGESVESDERVFFSLQRLSSLLGIGRVCKAVMTVITMRRIPCSGSRCS